MVTFHYNKHTRRIYNVMSVDYSTVYGMFNCRDDSDFATAYSNGSAFGENIIAWAYLSEYDEVINDEIQ